MAAKKKKLRKTTRKKPAGKKAGKKAKKKGKRPVRKSLRKKPLRPKKKKPLPSRARRMKKKVVRRKKALKAKKIKKKLKAKMKKKALKKKISKKKVIKHKRAVVVKKKPAKTKKQKKPEKKVVELTPEEIERISEILSRPIIRHMLVDLGGENAIAIVRNFNTGTSDEEIAKKLKLKISDVRAALNRLHSKGIVAYDRQKDSETGWYSYSWYLNREKMEKWATEQMYKFENPNNDGGEYYVCPSCGGSAILSFEDALDKNFRCEMCNHSLEFVDEKKREELGLSLQLKKRL